MHYLFNIWSCKDLVERHLHWYPSCFPSKSILTRCSTYHSLVAAMHACIHAEGIACRQLIVHTANGNKTQWPYQNHCILPSICHTTNLLPPTGGQSIGQTSTQSNHFVCYLMHSPKIRVDGVHSSIKSSCKVRKNSNCFRHDELDWHEDSSYSGDNSHVPTSGMEVIDF